MAEIGASSRRSNTGACGYIVVRPPGNPGVQAHSRGTGSTSVCLPDQSSDQGSGFTGSANGRSGSRLCENSDLSIVRKNPTAQNGPQSKIGASGDIFATPKNLSGWSFHTASANTGRSLPVGSSPGQLPVEGKTGHWEERIFLP